jgi:hypothetical protein
VFGLLTKLFRHYLIFFVILVIVCAGIFPFVVLYPLTNLIGQLLDSIFKGKKISRNIERWWDVMGRPYDFLAQRLIRTE